MKTLTIRIHNAAGEELAWVRMSSHRMLEEVLPETGGSLAAELSLPTEASDITTLGCLAAGAAKEAGLQCTREWQGRWELEHSTPSDREEGE